MEAGNASNDTPGGDRRVRQRLGALGRFLPSRGVSEEAKPEADGTLANEDSGDPAPGQTGPTRATESPFVVGLGAAAIAIVLLGGLAYFAAREFTGRAADSRASEEAVSFASHSSTLATGDAFAGYLQILRYADDDVVRAKIATREQREAVLQELVYLNTNNMQVLAVADRNGLVIASVGLADLTTLRTSEAFLRARSSLGPANSDILLPDGAPPYVEYATPLTDPGDGAIWGVLYGRASPDILWRGTIGASIDGSRNVIINQKGQFAAGVPQALVGQRWGGNLLDNGGVRVEIAGVDSICGLGAIAQNTQIDRGWAVASCLPASLIQVEAGDAMGQLGLVVIAGCVLAIVLVAALLRFTLPERPRDAVEAAAPVVADGAAPARDAVVEPLVAEMETAALAAEVEVGPVPGDDAEVGLTDAAGGAQPAEEPAIDAEPTLEPDVESTPDVPATIIVPDVSTLDLIAAYEARSARMAEQIRERLQAPLMIVASQAEAAFAKAADAAATPTPREADDEEPPTWEHPELADARRLHASAILELERLREQELRAVNEELYPAPVRLGLPSALRALARGFNGLNLEVDADADADSPGGSNGRPVIEAARRLVAYRTAREALAAAQDGGAEAAAVELRREGSSILLRVSARGGSIDVQALTACRIAAEAYGGMLQAEDDALLLTLPAPDTGARDERPPEAEIEDTDTAEEGEVTPVVAPRIVTIPAPVEAAAGALRTALEEAAQAVAGVDTTIDVDSTLEKEGVLQPELAGALRTIAGVSLQAAAGSTSPRAAIWIRLVREDVLGTVTLEGVDAHAVASPALNAARELIEARGGTVSVTAVDTGCVISIESPVTRPPLEDDLSVVRVEPEVVASDETAA